MYKIFTFGLIFSLVVQPVALSAPAFAAPIEDGDFSSFEVGDESELIEETEVLEEVVVEEVPTEDAGILNEDVGEDIAKDVVEEIDGLKENDEGSYEIPIEENEPAESQVYISKVYSGGDAVTEFVEVYNSGDEIKVEEINIRFYKSLDAIPMVIKLGKGVFKSKSSLSVGYVKDIHIGEIKYDGYYTGSKNDNLIGGTFAVEIEINGVSQLICSLSNEKCKVVSTDKNHIVQTCLETEDKSGDCNENNYSKVRIGDSNVAANYGGFIPDPDIDIVSDPDVHQPSEPADPKNTCENLKLNEIAANVDEQFIEIVNSGKDSVGLKGCMLGTDKPGSKPHIFRDDIELAPGEFYTLELSDSDIAIVKTTKREVHLLSEDGSHESSSTSYSNLKKDTSWSRFSDVKSGEDLWKQTYTLTPGQENLYAEFPACEIGFERNLETGRCRKIVDEQVGILAECPEGQYRHPDTNRCRKIESSTSTLTPCKPDQYRHPETNRCRKIESLTVAGLTPCKAGQYRHPETNRCRNIPVASTPTPCKDGYERNPETNRCRKIVTNTGASDSVNENSDESAEEFTGWLAVSGVGLLAAGVIGWEWRSEIYGFFQAIGDKFRFKRHR